MMWTRLQSFSSSNFVLGAACMVSDKEQGLVGCHAYSLLECREIFEDVVKGEQKKINSFFGVEEGGGEKRGGATEGENRRFDGINHKVVVTRSSSRISPLWLASLTHAAASSPQASRAPCRAPTGTKQPPESPTPTGLSATSAAPPYPVPRRTSSAVDHAILMCAPRALSLRAGLTLSLMWTKARRTMR